MSKIRLRQKQLLLAGATGGAIILLLSFIIGYFYVDHIKNKYTDQRVAVEQELLDTKRILEEETVEVEVLNRAYKAGELISTVDLTTVMVPRSEVPDSSALTKEELAGKYVKVDLPEKSPLTTSVVYEEEITPADLRNQEFRLIELPSKLGQGDYVDVRIKFPSGQDYIVLSKKKVEDLQNGTIWYEMNEREILTMTGAIVDAYINDASIYALTYVDPGVQNKAYVTYPANKEVLDLIDSDPNIVEKATTELERRNRVKLEEALQQMTAEEKQLYHSGKENDKPATNNNSNSDNSTSSTSDSNNSGQDNALLYNQPELTPSNMPEDIIFSDENAAANVENGE